MRQSNYITISSREKKLDQKMLFFHGEILISKFGLELLGDISIKCQRFPEISPKNSNPKFEITISPRKNILFDPDFFIGQISFWNVHFRGLLRYFGSQKGTQNILEMLKNTIFFKKNQHFQNILDPLLRPKISQKTPEMDVSELDLIPEKKS